MRFAVFLCLFGCLTFGGVAFAAPPCPAGSTTFTSSTGGNASNAATWSGSSIGNAEGACLVVTGGTVTIDQDLGVLGGTGVVLYANGGSFATPAALPALHSCGDGIYSICILINSTGSDPCGSGTADLPGADATAHGFFMANGNLSLLGTPSTRPVYINSADGTHSWYAAKTSAQGTANIRITGASLNNLGLGSHCGTLYPQFAGISIQDTSGAVQTIDLENSRITKFRAAAAVQASLNNQVTVTAKSNVLTGRTGPSTFFGGMNNVKAADIEDNTESAPASSGYLEQWPSIDSSYTSRGNAISGTAAFSVGGTVTVLLPASATISGDLVYNDPAQSGAVSPVADGVVAGGGNDLTVNENYCEGCDHAVAIEFPGSAGTATVTGNFAITNHLAQAGQGIYFISGGNVTLTGNIGVFSDAAAPGPYNCVFGYSTRTVVTATNNTCHNVTGPGTFSVGMQVGEQGFPAASGLVAHNLVTGFQYGIVDGDSGNHFADSYAGVGVHHNDVSNSVVPYQSAGSPKFDNGTQNHPGALYGDLSLAPGYLDPTRLSLARYDSLVLGGPGTVTDFITQLGLRSGWGGAYHLGNTPIADALTWFRTGFTPANPALCPGGVTTGAMPCAETTLSLSPAVMPTGIVGASYSQTLTANSGLNCSFSVIGILPPGLAVSFTGTSNTARISGTPTVLGLYSFLIGAVCANGSIFSTIAIQINPVVQPIDVSTNVKVTSSGLLFSRLTGALSGTVTIVNTGASPVSAPIQLVLANLIAGAALTNKTGLVPYGNYLGAPYITVPGSLSLAPGDSVSVPVKFAYSGTAQISTVLKVLSGEF